MKSLIVTPSFSIINLALLLFTLGTIIPAITFSDYLNIPSERTTFKGVGVILILASVFLLAYIGKCKFLRSELPFFVAIISLPFLFAISASIYDISESLVQWLRFLSVLLIVIFLFSLKENELFQILRLYCYIVLALAFISVLQYLVGYPTYEKFPLVNINSNKSIIFEQNVYGLLVYMSFLIFSLISFNTKKTRKWLTNLIYLFGIFISFYRTVYALILLRFILKNILISSLILISIFIFVTLYFSEIWSAISEIFKLDQLTTLTGRNFLWSIALESFNNAPFIGLGENAIPEISNAVLNRDPPYTTYHNVLFDVLAISGVLGFLIYSFLFIYFFIRIENEHRLIYLLLMAPALLNTYIAFMPNPLGGILGVFIFYSISVKRNRLNYQKITND